MSFADGVDINEIYNCTSSVHAKSLPSCLTLGYAMEEDIATLSSILAWRIPWTEHIQRWFSYIIIIYSFVLGSFLVAQMEKNLSAVQDPRVQTLSWEDPLERGMATHSSILAWRIPWTEEPGRLQSMGLQRVRNDWATNTFTFLLFYFLNSTCKW